MEFLNVRNENFYLDWKLPNFSLGVRIKGAQDKLPPNMAPRHTEYFKLKEFDTEQVQEGL